MPTSAEEDLPRSLQKPLYDVQIEDEEDETWSIPQSRKDADDIFIKFQRQLEEKEKEIFKLYGKLDEFTGAMTKLTRQVVGLQQDKANQNVPRTPTLSRHNSPLRTGRYLEENTVPLTSSKSEIWSSARLRPQLLGDKPGKMASLAEDHTQRNMT